MIIKIIINNFASLIDNNNFINHINDLGEQELQNTPSKLRLLRGFCAPAEPEALKP